MTMPREVRFESTGLKVKFTGLLHFATTTAEFMVPYAAIRGVSTQFPQLPKGVLRWGGTSVPFTDIREGHFRSGDNWYFLSFEDRKQIVTLHLEGLKVGKRLYRELVIQVPDPQRFVREIETRLSTRASGG